MRKKPFTMLELMTAMAVLMVFMLALMRFFTASQDMMSRASDKTEQYERARIAMDMLAADIENVYYSAGQSAVTFHTSGSALYFPVLAPEKPSAATSSIACKVYNYDSAAQTLQVFTGWKGITANWDPENLKTSGSAAFGSVSPDYETLIDGVKDFTVTLDSGALPDKVTVKITLLDKDTMTAIDNICKRDSTSNRATVLGALPANQKTQAEDRERVFSRDFSIDY